METMSKYGAKKTTIDGITFSSKAEANRYLQLIMLGKAKKITDLQLQVKYELAPSVVIQGRKRPPIRYVADFVYMQDGKQVTEDVKGMETPVYRLKRHLMATVHGIEILETR
jgi:hypothetical protein